MGKTTPANQIYHSFGEQFKYRAFVSVSRDPEAVKVLRGILSQLSKLEHSGTESGDERQLIDNILYFLRDKRYYIVIDDVWSVETWEIIKCAIRRNSFGSRVITTTRIKAVAESCSSTYADHVYEIRPLSAMHSKGLFLKRIFSSERQCPPPPTHTHLNRICDDILKKCGGLPLAIITISGLLANKAQTVVQWAQVQSSIGCAHQRYPSVERMIKILSLSYFDLHHDLKTCLLYPSIFPEDYPIEKSRLIRRWIAGRGIYSRKERAHYV
uniref:NB-ARC domain-containing protein n=1 Tax=Triticum urartu TaxID=4572 RepID=A0A8R7R8D6_TRIUA